MVYTAIAAHNIIYSGLSNKIMIVNWEDGEISGEDAGEVPSKRVSAVSFQLAEHE